MRSREAAFSLVELLMVTAIILALAAAAFTWAWRAIWYANEASAVSSLRVIATANDIYSTTYQGTYAPSLAALGPPPPGTPPSRDAADLIPSDLASGVKSGYNFTYDPVTTTPPGSQQGGSFTGTALAQTVIYSLYADPSRPNISGNKYMYVDETKVIRFRIGQRATASSPSY